jgi:hypothetical protein
MQEVNMASVLTDEARDTEKQATVEMDEELFVRVCDLYDAFDMYLSEVLQPLDYSAVVQEEVAVAFV